MISRSYSQAQKVNYSEVSQNKPLIGVVGGVGPEASNKFCDFLIKNKKVDSDQDNINFLHYCNPQIPDRTKAILGEGKSPVNEIVKTCNVLENSGASFLVIPCNTAHYFLSEIQEKVNIPIVDMIKLTVRQILSENPSVKKVGLLATTGSIKAGIYQNYFEKAGVKTIIPEEQEKVMEAIYGKQGIKAGYKTKPRKYLKEIVKKLVDEGAETMILGCTEIPLVLEQKDFDTRLYDPMEITANEIINYLESKNTASVKLNPSTFKEGQK